MMRCRWLFIILIIVAITGVAFNTQAGDKQLKSKNMMSETSLKSSESMPQSDANGPKPKIVFKTTEHDFGTKVSGENLEYTFEFKNEGDGTLIIEKVKGG